MESLLVAGKTICLPFPDEETYEACMRDGAAFRSFLTRKYAEHPELFPRDMAEGFTLQGTTLSRKYEGFRMRRLKLHNGKVYQVRPSFMLPYLVGRTDEVEKALYLRRFGVPFEALAYVFGKDAMYWYRACLSIGRNSIVGTTVKCPGLLPEHLVADEKHTRIQSERAYATTTVAGQCFLGVGLAENAGADGLTGGYAHFKEEARNLSPTYRPRTVNTDGWEPTQTAWKRLFPGITVILCFLHSFLKVRDRCKRNKELFATVKEKVWNAYHSATLGQFAQRLRRLREWALTLPPDPAREKVLDLCTKAPEFKRAFNHPGAYRTSAALERLMNYQDRLLYSMQYFHGTWSNALLHLRSMALLWNFHPYGSRARSEGLPLRASPFEELNGFRYHPNWLHNMLIAASLGGWRT